MQVDETYRRCLFIRRFEELVLKLFEQGKLRGTTHCCIGQEIIPVEVMEHLRPGDIVVSNHRCHGHYLARTWEVHGEPSSRKLLAELLGKGSGVCKGVGGSQHLCDPSVNFYTNGVQGNMAPVAVGMAEALKRDGNGNIICLFVGDGTFGQGVLYEALNLAAVRQLPLMIVVEDNEYAQSTLTKTVIAAPCLEPYVTRLRAFGFFCLERHKSHILSTLSDHVERTVLQARSTGAPSALVLACYRFCSHSKSDDGRNPKEVESARQFDPLGRFVGVMLSGDTIKEIEAEVENKLQADLAAVKGGV